MWNTLETSITSKRHSVALYKEEKRKKNIVLKYVYEWSRDQKLWLWTTLLTFLSVYNL